MASESASAVGTWLSSAAPFIASGVDSLAGLLGMSGSAHYQRRNMREAARLQHEENLFWAEYNSPANQMGRLREAGLNPNLVYGNGADAQFSGSVSPSGAAPEFKGHPGLDFITFSNMIKQNKNLDKQNDVLTQDSRKKQAEAIHQEMENEKLRASNPTLLGQYATQAAKLQLETQGSELQKLQAERTMLSSKSALIDMEKSIKQEFKDKFMPLQIRQAEIQNENAQLVLDNLPARLKADLKLTNSQAEAATAQIGVFRATQRKLEKELENLEAAKDLTTKQAATEQVKQTLIGLQSVAAKIQNTINQKTLPASIINAYLSPANLTTRAVGGFGIRLDKLYQLIGNSSAQMMESEMPSPSTIDGTTIGGEAWYY